MTTIGIRQDVFTADRQGRMTDAQLVALVKSPDHGIMRKVAALMHQQRTALTDGDMESATYIQTLIDSLPRPR